jgi:glycosyltransferase involved in cell wall biosynthesis
LHAHFAHNPTTLARYASLMTGIPYSFTAHAKDLYLSRPESLCNKAERATFIATCTGFNAAYLRSVLPEREHGKIHVVYHGVDTERFKPPLQRPVGNKVHVVSVGRLVSKKGYEYLVDAVRLLNERDMRLRLDVYGGGPLRDALQARTHEYGLDDVVHLHGACSQDELVDAYKDAHAFVLAPVVMEDGDRDGIPNVLLEAMASGLPVVSSAISGIPELVSHGDNGLLVPPRDSQALALALESLIESPQMRDRLGSAARATIEERFDAGENAQCMAAFLGIQGVVADANRVRAG